MKKQLANSSKYDWIFLAKSYLTLTYIGITELRKKYCKQQSYLLCVSTQAYDGKLLLIPIIWNIKHAIELVLKTHSVIFQKGYFKTHNLSDLKDGLANTLGIKDQSKDEKFDELASIVDKYYKLEVFNGKLLNHQTTFDIDNDIFRYPEGDKANFKLNLKAFGKVTDKDLIELQNDVDLIYLRLNILAGYKSLKQFWPDYSKGS